jgi:Cd(II)/Pb(II)-responsive transcriptional regulator
MQGMKIGELAKATQTPVATIRHYEQLALLPQAPRSEGNYRLYGADEVQRLGFIRHCRSLDMTLDEIRLLLRFKDAPQQDCGDVNSLLDEHIGHVATRIRELKQLQKQLQVLRERCAQVNDVAHCGILNELTHAATRPRPAAALHTEHVAGAHKRVPRRSAA